MSASTAQLGFDALLRTAEQENAARRDERACAHLPGTMDEALPFYRALIARHHDAMLAGDSQTVQLLRDEAHRLALKLNHYEPGILASEDSPGIVLDRLTREVDGIVPLWGQSGCFEIAYNGMRAAIDIEGLFGIGASHMAWLGFAARAVERQRPFLSETGYRSFLGVGGALQPGFTPATFVTEIVAAHVRGELKGKLLAIKPEYGGRE